jgi:hypothetical protein
MTREDVVRASLRRNTSGSSGKSGHAKNNQDDDDHADDVEDAVHGFSFEAAADLTTVHRIGFPFVGGCHGPGGSSCFTTAATARPRAARLPAVRWT